MPASASRAAATSERAALDLAVGALEDGEQLLVLGGGAGGRAAACRHGFGGFGGVLLQDAGDVRAGLDLVPRNVDARAVLAEHRAGGVFRVALGIVADGGDDALRVRAGLVAAQGAAQTSASAGVGRDLTRVAAQFKTEIIERLEQYALGLHQTLPHGAVGRLPEIAALGVLEVRAAREERHFYVGQRAARQHAGMRALDKVRENETLPVEV